MYAAPSKTKHIEMSQLQILASRSLEDKGGPMVPHLIMGDFNPTTWMELYEEWRCEALLWQLADPECPTHNGGGALDRVLLRPGAYTPEDGPHAQEESEAVGVDHTADALRPATVTPESGAPGSAVGRGAKRKDGEQVEGG